MPIFINTRQESCESRMTQAFLPSRLQQSLTRFLSDPKGSRVCINSKYEDLQAPGNSLSAASGSRKEGSVFTVSTSVPINQLVHEKMLRKLGDIRLKWAIISNDSQFENAGQIMTATQSNLIGLSSISSRDKHPHDCSVNGGHVGDKSIFHALHEPEVTFQEINARSGNDVQASSILRTGLTQVMNDLHPIESLGKFQAGTCEYRDAFRKKNYRYPDVIHSFHSIKNCLEKPSFQQSLYIFYNFLADRLFDLHRAFLQCLQSVKHSRKHVALFLECISFRYGDVILLLSRTTMRRVKFLYEKPPTTLSV